MEYSCLAIDIPKGTDCSEVLTRISQLDGVIVVNLALSAEGSQLIFTQENLQALLEADATALYLGIVPEAQYTALMRQQLLQLQAETENIRVLLRSNYLLNVEAELTDFLSRIQNVILMMECFALKKASLAINNILKRLSEDQEQLGVACFYLEDNVLCMDILHYRIKERLIKLAGELK